MGTDILFENHTIKEIQEIEKKLRNDIERKKEELRQMVGERYRDLMEAADTITEMKDIAESVKNRVKSIEDRCCELQEGSLQKGILTSIQDRVTEKRKSNELLYIIASQIKILMDCPTKIWSSIENKDFVSAVSLFLLARHTHSLLMLDPVYQEQRISVQFPIIKRQWASVNHLRYVLMQNCQRVLETQNIEPENIVGPMCCSCLLSNSSLEEVFMEILEVRKNMLKSIFRPEKYAKDQICEFVVVVQMTLKIIYALLYPEEELDSNNDCKTNLLQRTLQRVISKEAPGPVSLLDLNASETFKFLPSAITVWLSLEDRPYIFVRDNKLFFPPNVLLTNKIAVRNFRPSINEPIVPCSAQLLQSKCDHWLKEIKSYFVPELVNLLSFVNSVKSMALIREAVFSHLCEVKSWNKLCSSLLKMPFSIWDYFLKECFLQRIKDIINGCIKSSSEMCQQDIERTLHSISNVKEDSGMEFEKNISLYVWMESSNDVVDDIAWIPRHQRNIINSGELSMKAMGFTPKIQRICGDLDQRMQDAVEDISHFSFLQKGSVEGINLSSSQTNLLDISEDATTIFKYLEEAVESHIFNLASYIETTLLYMENEKHNFENSCRIVFMGHLCLGIANLCPHINTCLSPETMSEKIRANKRQALKENELWKEIKNKLQKVSASAFKLWGSWQIDQILKNLDSELIAGSAEGLLKALLMWEKVEIQEESEQGKSVKSVLRIPQHVSMPLSNALFGFCCQLNFIGGFAISSEVRSEISKQLLIGLLNIYQRKIDASTAEDLNPRLLQVQSLQYLFDVQFLIGFMVHKDNTCDVINSTSQDIMNQAISYIDPFDMDVFSAPLQQNLKKALQKSLSLFGLIASPDQVSYLNSIKAHSVSSQMEHNIMPSSNNIRRFPILPLSSRTNIMVQGPQDDFQVQTKETDKKPLQSHSSSPNLSASDIPTNPMKSTSFYDRVTAMSSSWFGN